MLKQKKQKYRLNSRREAFFHHFEQLASGHIQYRKRYKYFWNDIIRYCNYFIQDENSILEIGCATGDVLSKLKGKRRVGIDFSPKMIGIAREQHQDVAFHVMDAEEIDLDETFDVIILSHVTGYFDDVLKVFQSMKKATHPRTRIIVNYYNFLWEPLLLFAEMIGVKKKCPRQNWLSRRDVQTFLYLAGYDYYRVSRRMLLPVYIPGISYLFNNIIGRLPLINSFSINQFVFARPYGPDMPLKDYSVSVVIPARNESGNIEEAVRRIPDFGISVELIFIEGNSTDDTWEKIKEVKEKYPDKNIKIGQQEGKGKGDAVRKGFGMATGDILMILDADLTVMPEDLPLFYYAIASGKGEFINGSRLVYPMEKNAMRLLNYFGNKFFSMVFSWLLSQPIKDTLCGTKVLFRKDYEKLIRNRDFFGDFDPFGDFDLIFGAYKLNLRIIDLPIRYGERAYGETNISRFSHGFLLLKMAFYAARKIKFY